MTRKKEKEKYLEESLPPFVRLQVAYFVKAPFCHFYLALSNFVVNEEKVTGKVNRLPLCV